MNKDQLFQSLSEEDETTLLELLRSAYDFLSHDDRHTIFGQYVKEMPPAQIDGEGLLADIEHFAAMSQDGVYYAPFVINSKNFMHVPEETEEWFEKPGDFLQDSCQLTAQGEYLQATAVVPLAQRDSYQSLTGEVYATACRLANIAQKEKLEAEVKRLNIRTEHRW